MSKLISTAQLRYFFAPFGNRPGFGDLIFENGDVLYVQVEDNHGVVEKFAKVDIEDRIFLRPVTTSSLARIGDQVLYGFCTIENAIIVASRQDLQTYFSNNFSKYEHRSFLAYEIADFLQDNYLRRRCAENIASKISMFSPASQLEADYSELDRKVVKSAVGNGGIRPQVVAGGGFFAIDIARRYKKRLRQAVAAYRAALKERTRERVPLDWATTQNNIRPQVVAGGGFFAIDIGKRYKKRPVVRKISLGLRRGEVVGLLGPNGAGKTTCFYMMIGLIAPDHGHVVLDGQDVTQLPMYRRARLGVGYLPQEASIFRGLSVADNIRAVLEVVEPSRERREARLEALLAEFSITHLSRTSSLALTGGERRRVEIARALATEPNFILLDEPFAGIDPIAVGDIRALVAHLKDRGIGVLITDHNVRETLDVIDRAYIIYEGMLLMEGSPADIVGNPGLTHEVIGRPA